MFLERKSSSCLPCRRQNLKEWRGTILLCKGYHFWCSEIEKAKEGVAILLNDVWHSVGIDFRCVSSRILRIKFRFPRVKICVVVQYGNNNGNKEKR